MPECPATCKEYPNCACGDPFPMILNTVRAATHALYPEARIPETAMTRDEWKLVERDLHDDKVQLAMRARCEEQEHQWENCCSMLMQVYQQCKWCGERR